MSLAFFVGVAPKATRFFLRLLHNQGVNELNPDKLSQLIELKYRSIADATAQLGKVPLIRQTFIGFQRYLYKKEDA